MKFKPQSLAVIDCDSFAGQCYSSPVRSQRRASYLTQGPLNNSHRNEKSNLTFSLLNSSRAVCRLSLSLQLTRSRKDEIVWAYHFVERRVECWGVANTK